MITDIDVSFGSGGKVKDRDMGNSTKITSKKMEDVTVPWETTMGKVKNYIHVVLEK